MKRTRIVLILLVTLTGAFESDLVRAITIPITNPGFETQLLADGTDSLPTAPTGWSGNAFSAAYNPTVTEFPGQAPEGLNIAAVGGAGNLSFANMSQTLGTKASAGTYSLSYHVGRGLTLPNSIGYQVDLLAGTTVIGTDSNSQWPLSLGQFKPASLNAVIAAASPLVGQPLKLRFAALGGSFSAPTYIFYDDVKLQFTVVPEPSTWFLMATGAGIVLLSKRRR